MTYLHMIDGKAVLANYARDLVFSCIKSMFGEYVYSVRLKNMIQEMMLKATIV